MMTPFDYKYQNPSGLACLKQVNAIVIFTPLGIKKLTQKMLFCNPKPIFMKYSIVFIRATQQPPLMLSLKTGKKPKHVL